MGRIAIGLVGILVVILLLLYYGTTILLQVLWLPGLIIAVTIGLWILLIIVLFVIACIFLGG